ncbi:pectate lyase [Plebeiibacterium sediminum]|uniref:Pectic acid lyase n=1 Tax=Plebeiibacterium sediminum TaxID=2992112 RepID=A0AAE3M8W5_9BACT|nr:pectate lyase [Plebeiobacterium sediminum]MCW3789156.1 hypothetical protein [Plebeiobacterium sediminum]
MQANNLKKKAEASLQKGITYFHSLNTHGGYVYHVTPDLSLRWGEGPKDNETIEVQPPGTPAVGMSFLKAYQVTGNNEYLNDAKEAAYALIQGQNKYGGWEHTIDFKHLESDHVSFDDNQSQSAVRFLMALDQEMNDSILSAATQRAIGMMIETQLSNGGWPHYYPEQGNYHDYATFNDGGINDCIEVMIEAYQYYKNNEVIEKSLRKVARFLNISQLPPPQPGWAQQYNEYLQPAWARTFEPPAICSSVTIKNINSLIDLYLALHDKTILEPIPDALKYLDEVRMENGMWARFIELGTNKPLYYDRNRIRVDNLEDLHPERRKGYAYQINIEHYLEYSKKRYDKALNLGYQELWNEEHPTLSMSEINKRLEKLAPMVQEIIDAQESSGAWITKNDKFKKTMPKGERWNNQYEVMDRISSRVFNRNIDILCEYIKLSNELNNN